MFKIIVLFILLFDLFTNAANCQQQPSGVNFIKVTDWQQVIDSAESKDKYIFLDCYTTWCGPCRRMEKEIFADDSVGNAVNSRFVSVRLQMDTSKDDTPEIRRLYSFAKEVASNYQVDVYPTYLFFTKNGKIVHRGIGFKSAKEFISMTQAATKQDDQFYALVEDYKHGIKDYQKIKSMAMLALKMKDNKLADTLARDYIVNYLEKQGASTILKKDNLIFLNVFAKFHKSDSKIFGLYYNHPDEVDSVVSVKGWSEFKVNSIISKEEIYDKILVDSKPVNIEPDWKYIASTIKNKYNRLDADKLTLIAQLYWLKSMKLWSKYIKLVEQIKRKYRPVVGGRAFAQAIGGNAGIGDDSWALNVIAWNLFKNCDNDRYLRKGLKYSELSISLTMSHPSVQYYDTKAHLLYKLGFSKKAIACEQQALALAVSYFFENNRQGTMSRDSVNDLLEAIDLMRRDKGTWRGL